MTEHDLKTWPEYFQAIVENRKPFDYRLNDRDFKVGDVLNLREYVPGEGDAWAGGAGGDPGHYTGRALRKGVTFILDDKIGPTMREGFVVLGLGHVYVGPDLEPQPWIPMSDPHDLKVSSKVVEELGEAVAAIGRAMAQGIEGADPSTGVINRKRTQDELADVGATTKLFVDHFNLDGGAMTTRANDKVNFLTRWFAMIPQALKGRS